MLAREYCDVSKLPKPVILSHRMMAGLKEGAYAASAPCLMCMFMSPVVSRVLSRVVSLVVSLVGWASHAHVQDRRR